MITCDLLKFIILGVKGGSEMKGAAKNVREIIIMHSSDFVLKHRRYGFALT